jgi:hypothetical protein
MADIAIMSSFESVATGEGRAVVIKGRGPLGEVSIVLENGVAQQLAPALLTAAAVDQAPNRSVAAIHPSRVHLPIIAWQTGFSNANGQPILVLTLQGMHPLAFQVPAQLARECGQALIQQGERTAQKGKLLN